MWTGFFERQKVDASCKRGATWGCRRVQYMAQSQGDPKGGIRRALGRTAPAHLGRGNNCGCGQQVLTRSPQTPSRDGFITPRPPSSKTDRARVHTPDFDCMELLCRSPQSISLHLDQTSAQQFSLHRWLCSGDGRHGAWSADLQYIPLSELDTMGGRSLCTTGTILTDLMNLLRWYRGFGMRLGGSVPAAATGFAISGVFSGFFPQRLLSAWVGGSRPFIDATRHRMVCSRKQCASEKDACPECANPWATCSCVEPPSCWVCLESSGVLLCGCACRGTAGYVHVACIVEANKHRVGGRHSMCPTCEQGFVGELQMAVAKASMRNSETSSDFIVAKLDLADAYRDQGRFTDALQLFHQVLKHYQEQLGSDHPEVFWSFSVHHVLLLFTMI